MMNIIIYFYFIYFFNSENLNRVAGFGVGIGRYGIKKLNYN